MLRDFFVRNSLLYPKKSSFVFEDGYEVTFKEFNINVNKIASAFSSLGVMPHDKVAIFSGNCPEMVECISAAEKGAYIAVPINNRLTGKEVTYIVNDCRAKVLVVQNELIDLVTEFIPNMPTVRYFIAIGSKKQAELWRLYDQVRNTGIGEELAVNVTDSNLVYLFYTSGTTGRPKGVMLDQFGQIENAKTVITELELRPIYKTLNVLPLNHIGGKELTTASFVRGCTNYLMRRFDPVKTLEIIENEKIDILYAVPTIIYSLLDVLKNKHYDLSSLKTVFYSGSPMPSHKIQEAINIFGPILLQVYGATETGPTVSVFRKEHHVQALLNNPEKLKSCGLPANFVDVRIVDETGKDVPTYKVGEIIVKSDHLMKGYWRNPKATNETLKGGWVYTNDLGYYDDENYLYIVGRKKDLIISGGENIYAAEVEEVISSHPCVSEVAVIGVPDETWGEAVAAFIVKKAGVILTKEEIISYCKKSIGFKKPRIVEFLTELPKTSLGKIAKSEILSSYERSRQIGKKIKE
ncbi:fatty acid--CoA ligase [Paradesulfitobacterium aromaticivorans]